MSKITIKPEVHAVLSRSKITDNLLALPAEQLERKLYEDVNKVLTAAGGKWNRSLRAHVFPSCPREKLGLALESGTITDKKTALQQFFTPPELAERVVEIADVSRDVVLEPSAGHGALVKACIDAGAEWVDAYDIDPDNIKVLRSIGNCTCHETDFLSHPIPGRDEGYWRIVMNPPFTKNQDVTHVQHAVSHWLRAHGKLVAIMAGNPSRTSFVKMRAEIERYAKRFTVHSVPDGAFKSSGTNVKTIIVEVQL